MTQFRAFVVDKKEDAFVREIRDLHLDDLPAGDVTVRVQYSSVNFKDGLASIPNGKIVRSYPFIPGIDLAGTVVASQSEQFREGDEVLVTGYDLGVAHFGGFSEYARVPAAWLVPLPHGLTLREAMAIGTAGFTAALSVHRLEQNGLRPENGPVVVSGATGGVGSHAVSMLSKLGYHVVASTGKAEEHAYLQELGAKEIISREELSDPAGKPLQKGRWAGAVDPVGGNTLSYLLSTTLYGGSVAVSGLTGGTNVQTTVMPFILRGVNLLGIDSVNCPMDVRKTLWSRLASDLKPNHLLDQIGQEITLDQLPNSLDAILQGKMRGRAIVRL